RLPRHLHRHLRLSARRGHGGGRRGRQELEGCRRGHRPLRLLRRTDAVRLPIGAAYHLTARRPPAQLTAAGAGRCPFAATGSTISPASTSATAAGRPAMTLSAGRRAPPTTLPGTVPARLRPRS